MTAHPVTADGPPSAMPPPLEAERPTVYGDRVGDWCVRQCPDGRRKANGLYLTPVAVADFMARQVGAAGGHVRVLDPAAGAGVLACAAVEAMARRPSPPRTVEVVAYEVDPQLIPPPRSALEHLSEWCRAGHGVQVRFRIEAADFVLAHAEALRLWGGLIPYQGGESDFDVVIADPPYFKIGRDDPRAVAASSVVHGQPNIYGLFMGVGAALLRRRGEFIFIVPRSFASGPYFRRFREVFLDIVRPTRVHVFGSRRDAFSRDGVLQENVVLCGVRDDRWSGLRRPDRLRLSSSRGGGDLRDPDCREVPMQRALDMTSADKVLRLPISGDDDDVLALVDSWPETLGSLGLGISTGPVIPFRARRPIAREGAVPSPHVPLLWMNHVKPMSVTWPLNRHKPEYIRRDLAGRPLVPSGNYVLLRRFSAKEEARRLVAAPYIAACFDVPEVGLENHLNYIHRPAGSCTEDEVWGLAALYSSRLMNDYFRVANGNTQVSATELRAMPLPPRRTIVALGRQMKGAPDPLRDLDDRVLRALATPESRAMAIG